MPASPKRYRILFLDAYDSFTNNIASLLITLLRDAEIHIIHIDNRLLKAPNDLYFVLEEYDAVVCGPGPGSPENEKDVGVMKWIWEVPDEKMIPVLGICLGFQSLVSAFGGAIRRLKQGRHGVVREIEHIGLAAVKREQKDIFEGVGELNATLYHSLCVDLGQYEIPLAKWEAGAKWATFKNHPKLVPLAWARLGSTEHQGDSRDDDDRTLMAVRHRTKPFWGMQYHPESVCTDPAAHKVLQGWFNAAIRWNEVRGRKTHDLRPRRCEPWIMNPTRPSLLDDRCERAYQEFTESRSKQGSEPCQFHRRQKLAFKALALPPGVDMPGLVKLFRSGDEDVILLESSNAGQLNNDVRGRFSILGLDIERALRIEYQVGADYASTLIPSRREKENVPLGSGGIWNLLADFADERKVELQGLPETPFCGGFMGYVTYEMGLDGIGVEVQQPRLHMRPDICLVWVTKSVVIDHARGVLYIQELGAEDSGMGWIEQMADILRASSIWKGRANGNHTNGHGTRADRNTRIKGASTHVLRIAKPDPIQYEDKVKQCQEHIAAGDSYELCLTDQTTIFRAPCQGGRPPYRRRIDKKAHTVPPACKEEDISWPLYVSLRTRQPAPFTSYLRLGSATLVSGSPERFLSFSPRPAYQPNGKNGHGPDSSESKPMEIVCTMHPMKGTVRKITSSKSRALREAVAGGGGGASTLEEAQQLLHTEKETAENLMIVDLVRHDMHAVCGAGNVSVPRLMVVEEHASVWQMVTVVQGVLNAVPSNYSSLGKYTGLDVLAASLPPGSMTGAPKKRSCELLRDIEGGRERSLYSGVVGYMDAAGRGDWSVTIRAMFRWDDERDPNGNEIWRIGAGGAVTILSSPEGEKEEMFTKLRGPLGVLEEVLGGATG